MTAQPNKRVCVIPQLSGVGGMVSFREKLVAGLETSGFQVCGDLDERPYQAVLVIGGTRQIGKLRRSGREGARIVQRLDGMNWLHRRLKTGIRHYLRAEYGNLLLRFIRSQLAERIVYQSNFACRWWEQSHGSVDAPAQVIHNGVDLELFSPDGHQPLMQDGTRVLIVEGSLMGGYELGLEHAFQLGAGLARRGGLAHSHNGNVELVIVGQVPEDLRRRWEAWTIANGEQKLKIRWAGIVPHYMIPEIDRSAHLLFSADLNAACPNSVIEALACGTPVIAFDTGAIPELVPAEAGRIAPYGGNSWTLDTPDFTALVQAGMEVLAEGRRLRDGARTWAEKTFRLEDMVAAYQQVLFDD